MSTERHRASIASCPYCTGLLSPSNASRAPWDEVLWSDDEIYVAPTRGALLEGWLLVVPREHVLSSQALVRDRHSLLFGVTANAAARVAGLYGSATVFEHGAAIERSVVGCGVDHAHMHVLPLGFDLATASRRHTLGQQLAWTAFGSWAELDVPRGTPYAAVQHGDTVWCGLGEIPSQFFRRVIAGEMGCEELYDWRRSSGLDNIVRTLSRLLPVEPPGVMVES